MFDASKTYRQGLQISISIIKLQHYHAERSIRQCMIYSVALERRGSVVVSTSAWHAAGRWFDSRTRHVSLLGVITWLSTLEIVYLRVFRRRH